MNRLEIVRDRRDRGIGYTYIIVIVLSYSFFLIVIIIYEWQCTSGPAKFNSIYWIGNIVELNETPTRFVVCCYPFIYPI